MTTPTIEELLDKTKFEAWLRDHNPSANVGESQSSWACPIARYLQSKGFAIAWVGPQKVGSGTGRTTKTPLWASHFIQLIDSLPSGGRDHVKVRAYQAWAILGRIG